MKMTIEHVMNPELGAKECQEVGELHSVVAWVALTSAIVLWWLAGIWWAAPVIALSVYAFIQSARAGYMAGCYRILVNQKEEQS